MSLVESLVIFESLGNDAGFSARRQVRDVCAGVRAVLHMLWASARECALVLGVGKEVFGVGVLLGVLRDSLAADRPGPCGVRGASA